MTKTKLLIAALAATLALSTQVIAEDHKGHDASEKSMKCGEGKCGSSMKEKAAKPSKCGADHLKESGGKCAGKADAKKEAAEHAHKH